MQTVHFLWIAFTIAAAGSILYGFSRSVSALYWKVTICVLPLLLAGIVAGRAAYQYREGQGGFKLGVDLVGGTILVYEIDQDKERRVDYKKEQLARFLKRRIDPNDLYNVTIRPVGDTRVEIILPTGGARQAQKAEEGWNNVLDSVAENYRDQLEGQRPSAPHGRVEALAENG